MAPGALLPEPLSSDEPPVASRALERVGAFQPRESWYPRPRLLGVLCHNEGLRLVTLVELGWSGRVWRGTSHDAFTWRAGAVAAARAALAALDEVAGGRAAFSLEALDSVRSFDREVTVAHVGVLSASRRFRLVGCARSSEDERLTAARAALAAVNRVIPSVLTASSPGA